MKSARAALLVALFAASYPACDAAPVTQPIPFNHEIHMTTAAMQCDSCHEWVTSQAHAGIPRLENCLGCHNTDITDNPAAKPYVEMLRAAGKDGTEIPWVRVYQLPHHVYYSHRRHVEIGGLDCAGCHGDIARMKTPPERAIARTVSMDGCMDCHDKRGVANECTWCHR